MFFIWKHVFYTFCGKKNFGQLDVNDFTNFEYAILFFILCTNYVPDFQVHRSSGSRDMTILVFEERHLCSKKTKAFFIQSCKTFNHFGSFEKT